MNRQASPTDNDRTIRTQILAAAGAALTLTAAGPALAIAPALAVTRIDKLQNVEVSPGVKLTGNGVNLGQIELGLARTNHTSYNGKITFTRPGAQTFNNAHATHVAGIMIADPEAPGSKNRGVAPGAKLHRSDWVDAGGANGWSDDFRAAMDWFHAAPLTHIVNMSAGFDPPFGAVGSNASQTQRAADWLVNSKDISFVVAAGNYGQHNDGTLRFDSMNSPGAGYNVLSVGATGRNGTTKDYTQIATFSSRGPTAGGRYGPDIVAPGVLIRSPNNEDRNNDGHFNDWRDTADFKNDGTYKAVSGTSFATPQVSGTAALLHEYGTAKSMSTDPMLFRALFMNGADKSVKDDDGKRWDQTDAMTNPSRALDPTLGAGQLDAMRTFENYDAGKQGPGFRAATPTGDKINAVGWDRDSVSGVGVNNSNAYLTDKPLRKGAYLTSTLTWEREVNRAENGTFTYAALDDLDLGIAKLGAINDVFAKSNSAGDTVEHLVHKVDERAQHYIHVWQHAANNGTDEQYALAWHAHFAPEATRCFNGTFSGDRGSLLDNGWYSDPAATGAFTITKPAFMPQDNIQSYAGTLTNLSAAGLAVMSQEVYRPEGFFSLTFDYAFDLITDPFASFEVWLGGINLLAFDALPGDSIMPDGLSTFNYANYAYTFDDPALFDLLAGDFLDLSFRFSGFGTLWIDNVCYIPNPGTLALLSMGLGCLIRRYRA